MKPQERFICVIGLGQFGSELSHELASYCQVLAIDRDEERVDMISEHVQRALIMDARDFDSLRSVVTSEFDEAVVSLGESMEASILCTLHLKKIGVKTIRCKAMSDDHAAILLAVGATEVIFPERETARRVAAKIASPNLIDFIPVAEGYSIMDIAPLDSFHGKSLQEIDLRRRFGVFVMAVRELVPDRFVFLPGPDFVVKPSDILVIIGHQKDMARIQAAKANK